MDRAIRERVERVVRLRVLLLLLIGAVLMSPSGRSGTGTEGAATSPHAPVGLPTDPAGFAWVTVGVADLDSALELWLGLFGLELLDRRTGHDPDLEHHLGLDAGAITDQALVGSRGVKLGRIHFVEFRDPGEPVRAGARTTDLCPKNLDLYLADMPARTAELVAAGYSFRSPWVEYPYGDLMVREVQMPAHDETNVVLLELLGRDYPFSPQGYAGLASIITVVADPDREQEFYRQVVGLGEVESHVLTGPEIEKMVGLPPGSGLDVRLLGAQEPEFGRVELVHYQGIDSENLYPRATPPAVGMLAVSFVVDRLDDVRRRATDAAVEIREVSLGDSALLSVRDGIRLTAPSGFRVEVFTTP